MNANRMYIRIAKAKAGNRNKRETSIEKSIVTGASWRIPKWETGCDIVHGTKVKTGR